MNIACIFAAGSGLRMGSGTPKQFLEVAGRPILIHTLLLFQKHADIDRIYLAVPQKYISHCRELTEDYRIGKVKDIIGGGETAQDTIYLLLKEAKKQCAGDSVVLLHDGVRPFILPEVISMNIQSVQENGSAVTCTPGYETVLISHDGITTDKVPYRKDTFIAQAPQSFLLDDILSAHEAVRCRPEKYENMVDACTILSSLGRNVHMVKGNRGNIKITTPEDVYMFRALLEYRENELAFGLKPSVV